MSDNGHAFDPEARVARLAERVDGQGARITNLEVAVNKGFSDMNASFGKQFSDMSMEMRNRDRTPWGVIFTAIGVKFAVLFGIGGALYYPVKETMSETKMDIRQVKADAMSVAAFQDFKATYENNRIVSRNEYIDKFGQINTAIRDLNEDMVPRKELERQWAMQDQAIGFLRSQVEELKRENSSIYTQRDKMLDQQREIDNLETLIRQLLADRTMPRP